VGYILVTNDDGVESPSLPPLIRAVEALGPVRVVCPARERSWIGKAITRWEDIAVEKVVLDGTDVHAVHGFPADCTNLAVHSLFDEKPELVVSGVNIGLNTGLGFFLSSGTVGAAVEAMLAGIPALAFSVGRVRDDRGWKSRVAGEWGQDLWQRAADLSADIVRAVREVGFPADPELLSVNFPVEADLTTPRVITRLAPVGYGGLFRKKAEGLFVHDFPGGVRGSGPLDGTDLEAVSKGWVSITPVRMTQSAEVPPVLLRALRVQNP
jgi:5'-nucleotidase